MDGGRISLAEDACDHQWKESSIGVSILVVDDDITCLAIVSAILRKFKYKVVTVKHPKDALCTLRVKGGAFDLVVSDVHMPDMNGFELQQAIAQEFDLPVVLMSADDKESVALKGLECGAAFFIMKPVSADDLRDIWQFAAMKKKNQTVIKETPEEKEKEKSISDEISVSASSANEDSTNKKELRRKSARKEGSEEKNGENSQSSSQKRSKIVWTNSLHNRFLEAIRSIGLERAVPKKILEVMNVPGLTRENIASHLQKYRIFLRRVSDASYRIQSHKGLSRNFKTNCESSTAGEALILNPGQLPNLEISPSVVSGAGQSRLLSNRGNWQKPTIQNELLRKVVYNKPKPNLNLDTFPSREDYHSNYVGYSIRNFTPCTDQLHTNSTATADDNVNLDLLPPEQSRDDHRLHFAFGFGESAALSPIIDLSEFDTALPNQNHSQQNIINGGQTNINSNFYSSMVNWDNYVNVVPSQNANQHQSTSQMTYSQAFAGTPSQINGAVLLPTDEQVGEGFSNSLGFGTFTQLGRTVPSPSHERNDDDFLESLLNPYVEEDISLQDSD